MYENLPIISVTEYNGFVNEMISQVKFAVKGEISGYRVSQNKWVTFDLKDDGSKVNCFTTVYKQNIELEDGMEVICYGYPRIYVPYGKYSFNVDAINPVGEGALRKAFELTKKKLQEEGLFDEKYKKGIPKFPEKIGLVTSKEAAAYTDVLRILNNRWGGLEIYLKSVLVQGVNAPDEICEALDYFNKKFPVDVLIITRGGGSLEDLQAFNSENVCRSVFASKIPIIAGVGHERDVSLVDYVADKRASTPSNAAEIAVPDKCEFIQELNHMENNMNRSMDYLLDSIYKKIHQYVDSLVQKIHLQMTEFNLLISKFEKSSQKLMSDISQKKSYLLNHSILFEHCIQKLFHDKKTNLSVFENFLNTTSPKVLMEKGYSLTINKKTKKIIRSYKELSWGDRLVTQFKDGEIVSIVEDVKK